MAHVFSACHRLAGLSFCLAILAVAGCAGHPQTSSGLGDLPARYTGTLPCADCNGLDYSLLLSADHAYVLREHYDTDRPIGDTIETGRWRVHQGVNQLELTPADTDARFSSLWRIDSNQQLTALNENGQPVDASGNYGLTRASAPQQPDLAGPRWLLIGPPGGAGAPPAYIHFDADAQRVTGSTGCNRLMAQYQRNDGQLRIEQAATTRRACPDRADAEQAMSEALRRTQHFETLGNFLLLYGSDNDPAPLAVFHNRT